MNVGSAVDTVPPVATLETNGWNDAVLSYPSSLQHLGTLLLTPSTTASGGSLETSHESTDAAPAGTVGTMTTTPILVRQYLVAASHVGTIGVWPLDYGGAAHQRRRGCAVTTTSGDTTGDSAAANNHVVVDASMDTLSPVTPGAVYDTRTPVPIVQLTIAPMDLLQPSSTSYDNDMSNAFQPKLQSTAGFVAVNAVGTVSVLRIVNGDSTPPHETPPPTTSSNNNASNRSIESKAALRLELMAEWNTGRMGVTSLATMEMEATTERRSLTHVIVGYATGHVEAWSLILESHVNITTTTVNAQGTMPPPLSPPPNRGRGQPSKTMTCTTTHAHLVWRAEFASGSTLDGPPPSVAAVTQLKPSPSQMTTDHPRDTPHDFLVLTLTHDRKSARPCTGRMVEIVDATLIARAWNALVAHDDVTERASSENDDDDDTGVQALAARAVPILDFSVMPAVGREILDAGTIVQASRRSHSAATVAQSTVRPNYIPSLGTNSVCSIGASPSSTVAIGLADGMVVILESSLVPSSTPSNLELQWGVSKVMDQLCLSYPCIGMGCVDLPSDKNDGSTVPYIVCCMRGSATYLIPFDAVNDTSNATENDLQVKAVSIPMDGDEPISIPRYVQRFAAFNLVQCVGNAEHDGLESDLSLPILVYVWPGGSIDVFSYGLLSPPTKLSRTDLLLHELVSNGSAELLRSVLSLSLPCEVEGLSNAWEDAKNEIVKLDEAIIKREALDSLNLTAFRSILLTLSESN